MARNYQRDETLVYIRRVDPTQERSSGPRGQWDYHLMTSLPTNDNPRYSRGDENSNQDSLSDYYFQVQLGPSDFKIATGPYPQENGIDATGGTYKYSPYLTVQVAVPSSGKEYLYYWENLPTTTGQSVSYVDYRYYKLIETNQATVEDIYPYEALDFIRATGNPVVSIKKNLDNTPINTQLKFATLPKANVINNVPALLDQTGIMRFTSQYSDETVSKQYKLTYHEDYVYVKMKSQEHDFITAISVTPSLEYATGSHPNVPGYNPSPNKPVIRERGVVKSPNGIYPPWGTTDNKLESRRRADTALNKIPLLEICNKLERVGCAATHVAYKVGDVYPSVNEYVMTDGTIKYTDAPAVYMFINSTYTGPADSFYSRLPECWPWSCRRWTAESSTDAYNNKSIKYFKQDASGNKVQVSSGDLPLVNIGFETFTGHTKSKWATVVNTDPLALAEIISGPLSTATASDPEDLFTGYYKAKLDIPVVDLSDEQIIQCGCNENDAKIEFVTEIFPLLHDATCKLIIKAGYLCYATPTCNAPALGRAMKKIVYPFNSCKFNESLTIELDKLQFPTYEINTNSLDFYPAKDTVLFYVFTSGIKPIYLDPQFAPSGNTVYLDDGYSIPIANQTGYLSIIAKYPCKYTTDIQIYKLDQNGVTIQTPYPYNTIYNCPTDYLAKVNILGNGTDVQEDLGDIITGGDYYYSGEYRTFWNKCDKPKATEIYEAQSLGNAGGFINVQSSCCEYCREKPEGSQFVQYFPNPNCSALDLEATSQSSRHYARAGNCKIEDLTPCDNNAIIGKSIMRVTTSLTLETAPPASMDVISDFMASGVIFMTGTGLPMSGISSASGVSSYIIVPISGGPMSGITTFEEMIPPIENDWSGATGSSGSGGDKYGGDR